MIDLSFLTEEEQDAIMKVLQRDAALKRAEEERVRHLPEKVKDDQQLKNMSGQWFYEAKAKRHRDRIHGADIIRASMRKKRPQVAGEPSKDRARGVKESWVNNVNKDAFLPPELAGDVEEPEEDAAPPSPSSSVVNPASSVIGMSKEHTRKSTVSPSKERENPFNSSSLQEDHLSQQTRSDPSENGRAGLFQTSKEGELSTSKEKSSIPDISSQILEKPKEPFPGPVNHSQAKAPVPKARKMIFKSNDVKQDDHQSFLRQRTDSLNARGAPRGILKRNSSSSSTDSETVRFNQNFEPKSKIVSPSPTIHEKISEKEHSLKDDSSPNALEPLKHVRFSAVKDELPQSPGLIQGREMGEFSVLESDRLKNATEDTGDADALQEEPEPSQYRKPLPSYQLATSPGASESETQQPVTSGSFPIDGLYSHSGLATARLESFENSSTINECKTKSSKLPKAKSEFSKSPADELSHCVEPESSQVPGGSSRDHQQGKLPLLMALKAKTSSRSGPHATELMKTTDDSIAKVLDWFNRSSHSDDSKSSCRHLQGIESEEKIDFKSQTTVALVTNDASLKENASKALSSTQVEFKPVGSDSTTLQVERGLLPFGNYQDNDVNTKLKSMDLFQQGTTKEGLAILQPIENYGLGHGSKNMDCSQSSKRKGEGTWITPPTSNYSYSALKGPNTNDQAPCVINNAGILNEDKSKLCVHEKNTGNSGEHFDTSVVKELSSKDNMKADRKSKGDTLILKTSLQTENIELLPRAASDVSPWKKPEIELQEKSNEFPKNQVQRETYKRVSERISFWEGEKAASNLTNKVPTSLRSQGKPAKTYQSVESLNVYTGQSEYNQNTAKQLVLEKGCQTSHLYSLHSSDKETQSSKSGTPNTNEPMRKLPVADSLHSGRDISLDTFQHPLHGDSKLHTSSEKHGSRTGESKPNFQVLSLKERMDETNTKQVYTHSQFENLRKFWDLGANANSEAAVEKKSSTKSHKNAMPFINQKHKESNDIKSSGKSTNDAEVLINHEKVPTREEMEKLNSNCIPQVLPDETTFLWRPPRTSTHQLPGNESSKENVEKNTDWSVSPIIKKEKDYSDQDIEESIVKISVLPKDHKDTFYDRLQKLLVEASSPPSIGKVHAKQELEPDFSENRTCPQKTDLANEEKETRQPREIVSEYVEKTIAPPKTDRNTFLANLNKLLKDSSEISLSPLQTKLEPVTSGTNSEPEESEVVEEMGQSDSTSEEGEIIAPFPEEDETWGNTPVSQKGQSGECQLHTKNLLQKTAEAHHHLHRKSLLSDEATSAQNMPVSQNVHLRPQDRTILFQEEISETIEKVNVPPKTPWIDTDAALQRLLREAQLSFSAERDVVPKEVRAEFPEGIQAAGGPQTSLEVITSGAATIAPDRNDFHSIDLVSDKTHDIAFYVVPTDRVAHMSPTGQSLSSSGFTVTLHHQELPQQGAETGRETILQPKSQLLEFTTGLEKLLEEIMENFPSGFIDSTEEVRQDEFHPEEIKEMIEKSKAPLIPESAFDTGLEKLLEEITEAPYQPQLSVKEETPEKEPSQSEKAKVLGTVPHCDWTVSKASETKVLKSQANLYGKELRRDKALTDFYVPESMIENSLIPQLCVGHEIGTTETMNSPEGKDQESEVTGREGNFQEPGFQEAPEILSLSTNEQSIPLLMNQGNPTKASKVELFLASPSKRQEKEENSLSDSDFSDGNIGSNVESWKTISSSEEEPTPALKAMERSAARKMPSKSLEDISSDSSNQAKVDNLPEELVRSAEDDQKADQEPDTNECLPGISTVPSQPGNQFSNPDKLKRMSKSVPAFLQDESDDRETDTASESSYQLSRHKKSPSSLTNLSSSSGMTSLSSVSGSVMSVYSGDFGNLEVKGNIQFAVDYVDSLKELHVFVAQCKDLAAADVKKQRSDPYVKTYLLPDKGKMGKKKTLVVKKTLNPVYNEILRYRVEKQLLKAQKLNVSVWHRDTFKRNSFLGEVELDLETWDWDNKQNKQLRWYPLKRKTAPVALEAENRGEMKLALQYVPEPSPGKKLPTTGEVHIWVKECLDLPLLRGSHLNSFVKCTILPDTSRKSRQKTRAVGKTTNPVFNHTMVYDGFRPEDLTEACVELTVWDHYKLTNQFLGGLRIGFGTGKSYGIEVDWMDSTPEEVALWEKMVDSPNTWIEATLPLRMLLIAKISK